MTLQGGFVEASEHFSLKVINNKDLRKARSYRQRELLDPSPASLDPSSALVPPSVWVEQYHEYECCPPLCDRRLACRLYISPTNCRLKKNLNSNDYGEKISMLI